MPNNHDSPRISIDLCYSWVVRFFRFLTSIFFREIVTRGTHMIPLKQAVIFVAAPHANQFVDPMILTQTCKRQVHFLIAQKSMEKAHIRLFAHLLGSIPVRRPGDYARKGTGMVTLASLSDLNTLHGSGTCFTQEIKPHSSIQFKLGTESISVQVESVISDSIISLRRPVDKCLLELLSTSGLEFEILPHIDQSEVYNEVMEILSAGGAVAIFPEGGSHDRGQMLPLKAGVALMALGAMSKYPGLQVSIVPCGLNYFHPHQFRSRAVIEYGKPFPVDASLVSMFAQGSEERRKACSLLLEQIWSSLLAVTVNVPDFETLQVVQATRRLYRPTMRALTTWEQLELTRRFLAVKVSFDL